MLELDTILCWSCTRFVLPMCMVRCWLPVGDALPDVVRPGPQDVAPRDVVELDHLSLGDHLQPHTGDSATSPCDCTYSVRMLTYHVHVTNTILDRTATGVCM